MHRAAVRRTLFTLAVIPAWLVSAAVFFGMWPWRQAAGHLAVLGLIGFIVAELCLQSFRKIPFTCSYMPGRRTSTSRPSSMLCAEFERQALVREGASLAAILMVFAAAAGLLRWRTAWLGSPLDSLEETLEFEDVPAPAVMVLGLNRDGTSPV